MSAPVRVWTKSACAVLAWSALPIIMVSAGLIRSHPAQANVRVASSTEISLAAAVRVTAQSETAASPAARYVVQPGDTLSGIAARLAVPGGWPALYAANRPLIGPDPDVIRAGIVLALPAGHALTRYVIAPGDTLSKVAAALAVHGGWPAVYAANRGAIGADPNVIRPGTVLGVPQPASRSSAAPSSGPSSGSSSGAPAGTPAQNSPGHSAGPGQPASPGQSASPQAPSLAPNSGHSPGPARAPAAGMPTWLTTVLMAAGLLIGAAFLAEPVLAYRRRRAARAASSEPGTAKAGATAGGSAGGDAGGTATGGTAKGGGAGMASEPPETDSPRAGAAAAVAGRAPAGAGTEGMTRIIEADYDQVVVTHSVEDGTVYVLRPPDAEPTAILQAARLVLSEGPYRQLAGQLGMSADWPIVVADYDRVVVTCSTRDGTVYVLRPPDADPRAILRAARLVLPECSYGELADQLGVSATWPIEHGPGTRAGWPAE